MPGRPVQRRTPLQLHVFDLAAQIGLVLGEMIRQAGELVADNVAMPPIPAKGPGAPAPRLMTRGSPNSLEPLQEGREEKGQENRQHQRLEDLRRHRHGENNRQAIASTRSMRSVPRSSIM